MRVILFVVASLLCVGAESQQPSPAPTKPSNPPEKGAAQGSTGTDNKQSGTDDAPFVVKLQNTGKSPADAQREQYREEEKASRERWLNIFSGVAAFAAAILSVITGLLAAYTYKLWRATVKLTEEAERTTVRQAREMQESLRIAGVSADATKESADAAKVAATALARQAKAAFYVDQPRVRPVEFDVIPIPGEVDGGRRFNVVVTYKNFGKTPAFIVRIGHGSEFGQEVDHGLNVTPVYYFQYEFRRGQFGEPMEPIIEPGEDFEFHAQPELFITAMQFSHTGMSLFLWGQIQYRDYFDGVTEIGWFAMNTKTKDGRKEGFKKEEFRQVWLPNSNYTYRRYYDKQPADRSAP